MKVGIIGASSQVGSSLAFYFKHFTDVEPVCFVRSSYSQVFFKITGISFNTVSLNDVDALKLAFEGLDIVIDCTYPSGQLYEISKTIETNIQAAVSALPAGCAFVYMSTIMAYGMPTGHKWVEHFAVPQTTYAFIKRKAEKAVQQAGTKYGIKTYNFRLGQVHGFLQSVNGSYREKLSLNRRARIDGTEEDKVNVIFIGTLAEAIIRIKTENIKPGTYSLINTPQWSLGDLYNFYKTYYSFDTHIEYDPETQHPQVTIRSRLMNVARRYRPLFESYLLLKRPALYKKIKGRYRVSEVAQSAAQHAKDPYIDFHLLGENPGPFISNTGNAWDKILQVEKKMESVYESCLLKVTKDQ